MGTCCSSRTDLTGTDKNGKKGGKTDGVRFNPMDVVRNTVTSICKDGKFFQFICNSVSLHLFHSQLRVARPQYTHAKFRSVRQGFLSPLDPDKTADRKNLRSNQFVTQPCQAQRIVYHRHAYFRKRHIIPSWWLVHTEHPGVGQKVCHKINPNRRKSETWTILKQPHSAAEKIPLRRASEHNWRFLGR